MNSGLLVNRSLIPLIAILLLSAGVSKIFAGKIGKVSGIVLEDGSNKPLTDAKIILKRNGANAKTESTRTDTKGQYNFISLDADEYTLIIDKAFYEQKQVNISVKENKTTVVPHIILHPSETNVRLLRHLDKSYREDDTVAVSEYLRILNAICGDEKDSRCHNIKNLGVIYQNDPVSLKKDLFILLKDFLPRADSDPDNYLQVVPSEEIKVLLDNLLKNSKSFNELFYSESRRGEFTNINKFHQISTYSLSFRSSVSLLIQKFNNSEVKSSDVEKVINQSYVIDAFLRDNALEETTEHLWKDIESNLSILSVYYGKGSTLKPSFRENLRPSQLIAGTYRLNISRSDNIDDVINHALGNSAYKNDINIGYVRRNLERRLVAPDVLAIDKQNDQVRLASNLSPQVTFQADGVSRTETNPNGRQTQVKATSLSNGIEVKYFGDYTNDFYLTIVPLNNGRLAVTRRLNVGDTNRTVTAVSIYDKTSLTADFSVASGGYGNYPSNGYNDFIIPNTTPLVATLDSQISTKDANEGDRFTMTVNSPVQYNGATIEGYLSNTQKSGRVVDRAQITFNFERIRLRNGRTYRYSGIIDQVQQPNGDRVSIEKEGETQKGVQTIETAHTGVGAGLGAIIGAIAGGGKGAAIGAGVGTNAGTRAGSVVLQGSDNLTLQEGSILKITSSAPAVVDN